MKRRNSTEIQYISTMTEIENMCSNNTMAHLMKEMA